MAQPTRSLSHFVDGADAPCGTETIDVVNPATGEVVGRVPAGTAQDVDRAVDAARAACDALQAWALPG